MSDQSVKDSGKSFWDGLEKEGNRINTNHPVFQVGRFLYDAQVVHARLEKGETIEPETIKLLCERYCQLVTAVGQLRAYYKDLERECDTAKEKIKHVFGK